ncbi:MAG: hypothetical protein IJE79_02120 [Alphaproteobacteria bacterium]|nr:hypothetical protein [Alphaproteobacteria bacterium]
MNRTRNLAIALICTIIPFSLGAAPSVRTLGGAGTFDGSNKAQAAKANTTKNIRSSSVRADGATNVGRIASNSRLSIGKYLGGASTISGSASKPSVTPDLSGVASDDDLKVVRDSVAALENFVGYSEIGDTIAKTVTGLDETVSSLDETVAGLDETVTGLDETVTGLNETVTSLDEKVSTVSDNVTNLSAEVTRIDEIDRVVGENSAGILELQERLSEIAGEQIQITYENGILTLIQPGVAPQSYDLLKGLDSQFANKADKAEVDDLNNRLDGLNNRLDNLSDAFVGTSQDAVQTLQGQYSVSGKLYVDTPALP